MTPDARETITQRKLVSNALASMVNVVLGSVMLFALYRVLLSRLGPETLGLWSLLIASVSSARLAEMGLAASVTRYVATARAAGDHREAVQIVQTATLSLAALGALAGILALQVLPHLLARVLSPAQLGDAMRALPWALTALATGIAAGAAQSALDGCQRVDLRVWVALAGQAVLLAAAVPLAASHGLAGVAMAQALQSLLVLLGSWGVLRTQLRGLPVVPTQWSHRIFRGIASYSALFQLNSILLLLLDPLAKFMLASYGGLSATAYFDMANQLVQRLRLLPASAAQVLVPAIAHAKAQGGERILELYSRSYGVIFAVTVPCFCLAAALVPAISAAWIGSREPLFMGMTWICLAGWGFSTIGTPAYFSNLGTGLIATNTAGHTLSTLVAGVLGWAGGLSWGPFGVCAGYAAGVAVGGLYVQIVLLRRLGLALDSIVPRESRLLLSLSLLAVMLCLLADLLLADSLPSHAASVFARLLRIVLVSAAFLVITGFGIWLHPLRRSAMGYVFGLRHPQRSP